MLERSSSKAKKINGTEKKDEKKVFESSDPGSWRFSLNAFHQRKNPRSSRKIGSVGGVSLPLFAFDGNSQCEGEKVAASFPLSCSLEHLFNFFTIRCDSLSSLPETELKTKHRELSEGKKSIGSLFGGERTTPKPFTAQSFSSVPTSQTSYPHLDSRSDFAHKKKFFVFLSGGVRASITGNGACNLVLVWSPRSPTFPRLKFPRSAGKAHEKSREKKEKKISEFVTEPCEEL